MKKDLPKILFAGTVAIIITLASCAPTTTIVNKRGSAISAQDNTKPTNNDTEQPLTDWKITLNDKGVVDLGDGYTAEKSTGDESSSVDCALVHLTNEEILSKIGDMKNRVKASNLQLSKNQVIELTRMSLVGEAVEHTLFLEDDKRAADVESKTIIKDGARYYPFKTRSHKRVIAGFWDDRNNILICILNNSKT